LRGVTSRVVTAQGSFASPWRLKTPGATSVPPLPIYPNLSYLEHPSLLASTNPRSEGTAVGDHTETRRPQAPSVASAGTMDMPWCRCARAGSPGAQRQNRARFVGPPLVAARESSDNRPHPRCLPPSKPPPPFERRRQDAAAALGFPALLQSPRHLCYPRWHRP
jgi:hypothetical protein